MSPIAKDVLVDAETPLHADAGDRAGLVLTDNVRAPSTVCVRKNVTLTGIATPSSIFGLEKPNISHLKAYFIGLSTMKLFF